MSKLKPNNIEADTPKKNKQRSLIRQRMEMVAAILMMKGGVNNKRLLQKDMDV
ncbi:hypothetical protein [Paenibacillus oryzae]|uniref:hypothetical protein n=1 Tax=Paenibacillus oryzae TaxID=1844972 RepID=UPI0012EA8751|nr:hypothetical protein [Paenibacillus oryzae]